MTYVTSDLHGCAPELLFSLLQKVGFSQKDVLYILGDAVDRGTHGAELLLWMTQQTNVEFLLGNHEVLLLACSFVFEQVDEASLEALSVEKLRLVENWLQNGGGPTMAGFQALMKRDPETAEGILDYLQDCPLYEVVQVGGRRFILVHAGLENFAPDRALETYEPGELLMARPTMQTRYDLGPETMVIFGHTPTVFLDPACGGKAIKTSSWICIDPGTALGNGPMLLRLEDLTAFYL